MQYDENLATLRRYLDTETGTPGVPMNDVLRWSGKSVNDTLGQLYTRPLDPSTGDAASNQNR